MQNPEEVTLEQIFQNSQGHISKDVIVDNWFGDNRMHIRNRIRKIVVWTCPWSSMGRALGNNLLNLTAYGEVKEA